jgi:hypothetical protein
MGENGIGLEIKEIIKKLGSIGIIAKGKQEEFEIRFEITNPQSETEKVARVYNYLLRRTYYDGVVFALQLSNGGYGFGVNPLEGKYTRN